MQFVSYEKCDHFGVITIDRPDALNALDSKVLEELKAVLLAVDLNDTRCLIITGAGEKAFVAGADVSQMSNFTKAEGEAFVETVNILFLKIEEFPIPIIAAINGYALGGGCELAMCCDIRICSENAKFGQPEVGLGIIPGFGGTQRLPKIIGAGRAKEMIYAGATIDAQEAWRIGLVNHVYKQEELLYKAKEMALKIAAQAPIAVRNCKKAISQGSSREISSGVRIEEELFGECFETLDQKRGMKAFLEKWDGVKFTNE